jgi:YD repeat-containing protein
MALVSREVGTDGQGSSVAYSYDDASLLITQVLITQNAQSVRQVIANVVDSTGTVLYTATRADKSGYSTFPASQYGIHMLASVDKLGHASVVFPYTFQIKWGPAQ